MLLGIVIAIIGAIILFQGIKEKTGCGCLTLIVVALAVLGIVVSNL
jgi:hypothetical protein